VRVAAVLLDPDLPLPEYAMPGDAALDLVAREHLTLPPGKRAVVPTGIALALPEGYAGFVQPRSGRALHEGLGVANTPGLIDSGYRGEIKVVVVNLDTDAPIEVRRGEKIAQLVVQKVENIQLDVTDELPPSNRGEGGFGSTGL
jgi:dUTP pyrophosphatase